MIEAGTTLQNRYLINKQIGSGGMGTVYLATDERLGSSVAVKETLFDDTELQRAFEREAQLLNSLRHPALPHVIDYFTEGDRQYLVMEYFAGEDLSEILKRKGAFPIAEVLRWVDDLLDAIIYLHSRKIPVVHRDIKPQNLKLTPNGEIILLDFGLAKGKPGEASQISRTNSIFGYSRSYAPLEQIQGTGTDTRSDIYSLGATIYHLLTGKPPVDALTRATTFVNNQPDPLIPANAHNPQIPASIALIVHQALNLNPDLRPQTAAQLRESISHATSGLTPPDPDTTKIHATAGAPSSTADFTHFDKSENLQSIKAQIRQTNVLAADPFEQSSSFAGLSRMGNRPSHSAGKFASITAAILILGGGSVAAWYSTSYSQSGNAQSAKSNLVANVSAVVKPVANGNVKTEEKVAEKAEEKSLNPKPNTNLVESKQAESLNKTVPLKIPSVEPAGEDPPAPKAQPIVVKSAAPAEDSGKSQDREMDAPDSPRRKSDKSVSDDLDDAPSDDSSQKRKKDDTQPAEDRIERRERRALPDKRKKQKLPTLLGAPQD